MALRDIFNKTQFKILDFVIILTVLTLSAVLFVLSAGGHTSATQCVIEVNGEEYSRIDLIALTGEKVINIDNQFGTNVIVIDRYGVRVTESSCLDKTEVLSGRIDKAGQSLVCLPNRLVVRLEGKTASDAVSW